jgi:hypothetical protein
MSRFIIVVSIIVALAIFAAIFGAITSGPSVQSSTIVRERLDTDIAYKSDCIVDEIGWINNPTKLSSNLKEFYNKTGCQPFIYLRAYDSTMDSESAREQFAFDYYADNFANAQNTILYIYFCDEYDEGYGYDTLTKGTESAVVFDSEAEEIFWNYLDYDWDNWDYNDNDGMFADVFNSTANNIMHVSTTSKDITKYVIIAIIVLALIGGGIAFFVIRAKREKEKNEETARILNSNIHDMAKSDLENKYLEE